MNPTRGVPGPGGPDAGCRGSGALRLRVGVEGQCPGQTRSAIEAYRRGIDAAQSKGDIQAAKEMRVFRRRLEKGR